MKKSVIFVRVVGGLSLFAIAFGFAGCLSIKKALQEQETLVTTGDYEGAYQKAAEFAVEDGADQAFWSEEAGVLALMTGKSKEAVAHLNAADDGFNDVARRRYGSSAMDTAVALAGNDCTLPYAPDGVDRVFVNVYKALAYGMQQKPESMRVELNRARQRQIEWFGVCAGDIAEKGASDLSKDDQKAVAEVTAGQAKGPKLAAGVAGMVSQEGAGAARHFVQLKGFGNAYAAHLAGITRWCAGDSSRNDLAMAAALAPQAAAVVSDARKVAAGGVPTGRVWVYVEDGLGPRREGRPFTLPLPSIAAHGRGVTTVSFDVPKLVQREWASGGGWSVTGGGELALLADVDALMTDQFDRAWAGIIARQVARTLIRVAISEGGQAALRNTTGGQVTSLLWSATVSLYDVATNEADLRCADLLPKGVWVGALERPESGRIELKARNGVTVPVQLPAESQKNAVVWVRLPAAGARPVVAVIELN